MRIVSRFWIVFACVMLLVACGNGEDAPPGDGDDPSSVTSPVSTTLPESEMEVGQIIWAQSTDPDTGEPGDTVTRFTTQSLAIIAVIEVDEVSVGTQFVATWTINDQPIEGTTMEVSASEDLDHAWIAFSFTRNENQLYPVGQVNVVITTSEGHLREGSVEIGFP